MADSVKCDRVLTNANVCLGAGGTARIPRNTPQLRRPLRELIFTQE